MAVTKPAGNVGRAIQALCLSALALPGMISEARAENDDEAGYQFSHYEEGVRDIYTGISSTAHGVKTSGISRIPNQFQPINVDSEHGFARFRLTDRLRFAFNYIQDVWSGASPISTAPASMGGNNPRSSNGVVVGASPLLKTHPGTSPVTPLITGFFDAQGRPLLATNVNSRTGAPLQLSNADRLQQTMGYASPEIRNQADFKLGYDWDNASLDLSGGTSIERDYLSRFGNLAGRMDFNEKHTTVNMGLSYANSDTRAELDPATSAHISTAAFPGQFGSVTDGQTTSLLITGNRQDTALTLALSQVLNKNAVLTGGFGYTNSSGYLSNAYKEVTAYLLDPNWRKADGLAAGAFSGVQYASKGVSALEHRPNLRNQFNWDASYRHYIPVLEAAGQLSYTFFHDDWGINAHTFAGEWRQSLGETWTLTPNVRYYSQSAAGFYAPYIFSTDSSGNFSDLATRNFSSDQRLSAYGALSGGIILSKQFARGLNLDLGFEYYAHASSLRLGGDGSGSYLDYHYYAGNATLRANLGQLAHAGNGFEGGALDWFMGIFDGDPAAKADVRNQAPAGVMFARMLKEADSFALGYRYLGYTQGGSLTRNTQSVSPSSRALQSNGCPLGVAANYSACTMLPSGINTNIHQLEILYAPSDWLNLLLMPRFVSTSMNSDMVGSVARSYPHITTRDYESGGGIGDTGAYALFKLWDGDGHRLHLTQGFTAPTGSIRIQSGLTNNFLSYNLQTGSGTWDYEPSLTYTGNDEAWFWGGQLLGAVRMQKRNSLGYALGDIFQTSVWAGYQMTSWLSGTLRGLYTGQSAISGQHPMTVSITSKSTTNIAYVATTDSAQNYGGTFADVGFGVTAAAPSGPFAGHKLSFEWLQPVYTSFNGYQLDRTGTIAASWNYSFQ